MLLFPRPLIRALIFALICFVFILLFQLSVFHSLSNILNILEFKNTFLRNFLWTDNAENHGRKRELVLLQVIFRHGLRSPFMIYPTDVNNNMSVWPEGLSMLTKLGRLQNYMMGAHIKKRYKNFINTDYEEVEMISSEATRAHYSAYSFMAGLYAPTINNRFKENFAWQPIPAKLADHEGKGVLLRDYCPIAEDGFETFYNSKLTNETLEKFAKLYEFLTDYSGRRIENFFHASDLGKTLRAELKCNLTVPDWAWVFWDELKHQTGLSYFFQYGTKLLLRYRIGPLVGFMIEKMYMKIKGRTPRKRVFVYSTHGSHMSQILLLLNKYNFKEPHQASTITLELWKGNNDEYSVRWLYFNSTSPEIRIDPPATFYFDECGGEFCPLELFVNRTKPFIPYDTDKECYYEMPYDGFDPLERFIEFPPLSVYSSQVMLCTSPEWLLCIFLGIQIIFHRFLI